MRALLPLGLVIILIGLVLSTDRMDRWYKKRRQLRKAAIYPWGPPPERQEAVKWGGCKDCGTIEPRDCYDRCRVCAELCELRGGVKSQPRIKGQSGPSFPVDMAGFQMEKIYG